MAKKIVNSKRFFLLQNAIDTEKYAFTIEKRNLIHKEFNLQDQLVLGNVGRLTTQKNHDFLIDIFAEVHKRNENSVLMIVGDGNLKKQLRTKVQSLGLEGSVIFTGGRSDVANILSAIDVFVFPSLHEGLPVTLVEAQAAGIVCLVSDTVTSEIGISELVHYLPIDRGTKPWVDAIEGCFKERKDVRQQISAAGYDIRLSSNFVREFYQNLYGAK